MCDGVIACLAASSPARCLQASSGLVPANNKLSLIADFEGDVVLACAFIHSFASAIVFLLHVSLVIHLEVMLN